MFLADGTPYKVLCGSREYDPVNVGYRVTTFPWAFTFDTTIRGNSNSGQEFTNTSKKEGVMGRKLTHDELSFNI